MSREAGSVVTSDTSLPIDAIVPDLKRVLDDSNRAVVIAPPGAGKTTGLPLALLDAPWVKGRKIIVVEPRRLAARAAARRMADTLSEAVGQTIGFSVRMESRTSPRTRIELVTTGVFVRMILDDPELSSVAAVLFDEAHERSLDMDLGLALTCEAQAGLRDDLRLVIMSATLDGAGYADLLRNAPLLESEGRLFDVETRYRPVPQSARRGQSGRYTIAADMADAVLDALADEDGSILAFLPGQGEILRTADRLSAELPENVDLHPLYGALASKAQDAAITPPKPGRRKIVLATSVAETSLTIEGVRIVIDSGWARRPAYDPGAGLSRLETVRVSRAAADQRRGRAGRTGPGVCIRLWDERQTKALQPHDRPEILDSDLSGLALSLLSWGVSDPSDLIWRDPPPRPAFSEAIHLLQRLGACDERGFLTPHGRALATLPLPPRLGNMLIAGGRSGLAELASQLAALLSEPGLGGRSIDVRERLDAMRSGSDRRLGKALDMARRWARLVPDLKQDAGEIRIADPHGWLIAEAFSDRIAQARGGPGRFRMANGSGAWLEERHELAGEPFLAIAELQGGGADVRILSAAPISRATIEQHFGSRIEQDSQILYKSSADRVVERRRTRLGALVLSEAERAVESGPDVEHALAKAIMDQGLMALPWNGEADSLRDRVAFVRARIDQAEKGDGAMAATDPALDLAWPNIGQGSLTEEDTAWLQDLLTGKTSLGAIRANDLLRALSNSLTYNQRRTLDEMAPAHFSTPLGTSVAISYSTGEPLVRCPPQALFGLTEHPSINQDRDPIVFELLSPAGRPIQVTRDLPGFWNGSWRDVRADMRGRYPKHAWPDDPVSAQPVSGVRRRS